MANDLLRSTCCLKPWQRRDTQGKLWHAALAETKIFLNGQTARKGSLVLIDQAVSGATNFLTTVIIARAAGKEELGLYTLGLGLASILLAMQNSLILTPYTVYSPRYRGDAQLVYAGSTLVHSSVFAGLSIVVLVVLGCIFTSGVGPASLSSVCWALVISIPFILLKQYARMVSFAHLRIKSALAVDSSVGVLQICGLLALAYCSGLSSAFRAYLIVGAACGMAGGSWLFQQRGQFIIKGPEILSDFRRNWKFSRWLAITIPVANLRGLLGPWLLAFFHGLGPTALFAACFNITSMANPFLTGASNLIGPKAAHAFAQAGIGALRRLVLKAYIPIGLVMVLFSLAMIIFGGRVVSLVYGDDYAGLGTVVFLLAAGTFVMSLGVPSRQGLLALESSRAILISELVPFILQAPLGLWLIIKFGVWGAAATILVGHMVDSALLSVMFSRRLSRTEKVDK